eukprot:CAMPEP_0206141502 /NCGR_PEP_ID=MMETSP1473-20131121/13139_1 /ASSEMBLY_ACC=CAM_ASM_001109 /TAXON_ID=1461547 /ORGANISM="Stichococcus sp, Strain RCC1054" /LENGTH=931 /DNA_ID=CAMNT_0053536099 /DNA_START=181 /DNA_END=2976 /DNA_ORIENTATION=+
MQMGRNASISGRLPCGRLTTTSETPTAVLTRQLWLRLPGDIRNMRAHCQRASAFSAPLEGRQQGRKAPERCRRSVVVSAKKKVKQHSAAAAALAALEEAEAKMDGKLNGVSLSRDDEVTDSKAADSKAAFAAKKAEKAAKKAKQSKDAQPVQNGKAEKLGQNGKADKGGPAKASKQDQWGGNKMPAPVTVAEVAPSNLEHSHTTASEPEHVHAQQTPIEQSPSVEASKVESVPQIVSPQKGAPKAAKAGAWGAASGSLDDANSESRKIAEANRLSLEAELANAGKAEAAAAAAKSSVKSQGGKAAGKAGGGKGGRGSSSGGGAGSPAGVGIGSGVKLENIHLAFRNQQVLRGVSWDVKKGERVGLVGINGAGKTTQLQIIKGILEPDQGEVIKSRKNMKISHLSQEFDVDRTRTVREEFMSAFTDQMNLLKRQEEIQVALENVGEDMDAMSLLLDELAVITEQATELDVTKLDQHIDRMMPELGFTTDDNDRLVASYSGGWQMRMCLGKILLSSPDLLLLDEPTNHLDLDTIEWLEGYLKKQDVPMVIVSHDREFLDQLCTKIVHTEWGHAHTYPGNYSQFVQAQETAVAQQWTAYEKQQKEIARQEEIMQRLSAGSNTGRASTAEKTIEKLNNSERKVRKPFEAKKKVFFFPAVERMGQKAVSIKNLTHGYGDHRLFDETSLEIERGERVALIGPNGAGKSTLLRLIMGREQPIQGHVELGLHNIVPNYFEQNQAEALDPKLSAIQVLENAAPNANTQDVKALLGRMLFSGSSAHKKVEVLSGGEKARLALAKFMLTQGSLLVLDEPTNHLDIPSKETLEAAIRAFQGSVIAVSHDRYFLKRIATRVVAVENAKLVDYEGDYVEFLDKNVDEAELMAIKEARAKAIEQSNIKSKSKMSKAEKMRLKKQKAQAYETGKQRGKLSKNAGRWK